MGVQVHHHRTKASLDLEAGKQTAALLRLALLSGGTATIVVNGSPEMEGILNVLAHTEGMDWSKILILPLGEYFGISRNTKGSLQYNVCRRLISVKPGCSPAGLINGEGVPSSELKRLNALLETRKPDVFLTSVGPSGEIGLIESTESSDHQGYYVAEPSETYRRHQVTIQQFRSVHDVPRKGMQLALANLSEVKHIVCCLAGKEKASIAHKLAKGKDLPTNFKDLISHPDFHLHLEADAAEHLLHRSHPS